MPIKVIELDHEFRGSRNALGSFLIEEGDDLILIESGPASTYPNLIQAIETLDYDVSAINHVFLSHIHLDHAGGAWKFAEKGATVYVHELGYKHLLDPSRLMASARQIYKDQMDILWGEMRPISADNLKSVNDGDQIQVGNLIFEALYTPGHAKHHVAWKVDDVIFTGDVAGARVNDGPVVPPCPPPDIDIELWKDSLKKLGDQEEVKRYYLTHFGEVTNLKAHRTELYETLDSYADFIKTLYEQQLPIPQAVERFVDYVNDLFKEQGLEKCDLEAYAAANPPDMSVPGLYRYWKKKKTNR